ncbi:hypothetical protein [Streptomyces sp. ODS28]|uniref:hypothetical protein n=1 Tax=Streptomyces sp. ODS28 TaxID=3136688 RepID=UPI0031ED9E10
MTQQTTQTPQPQSQDGAAAARSAHVQLPAGAPQFAELTGAYWLDSPALALVRRRDGPAASAPSTAQTPGHTAAPAPVQRPRQIMAVDGRSGRDAGR